MSTNSRIPKTTRVSTGIVSTGTVSTGTVSTGTVSTASSKTIKELLSIFFNTFTNFFEKVNSKIFKNDNNFKEDVQICLKLYLIIFLIIILIFSLTTSIVTIKYHEEICENNKELKDDMNIIFNLAIFNIVCTFIFILFCVLQYYEKNYILIKILVLIFFLLIISLNMAISSNFIINISKCTFETNHLYNYMWINYAITLPICLLILILFYILYFKI